MHFTGDADGAEPHRGPNTSNYSLGVQRVGSEAANRGTGKML